MTGEGILLVEDEPQLQRLMRRVLEGAGLRVALAARADEALGLLGPGVDALVLDAAIAPGGALPVLERVAEAHPDLPVVVTSGEAPSGPLRDLLRQLQGDFLSKPFAPTDLLGALARAGLSGAGPAPGPGRERP